MAIYFTRTHAKATWMTDWLTDCCCLVSLLPPPVFHPLPRLICIDFSFCCSCPPTIQHFEGSLSGGDKEYYKNSESQLHESTRNHRTVLILIHYVVVFTSSSLSASLRMLSSSADLTTFSLFVEALQYLTGGGWFHLWRRKQNTGFSPPWNITTVAIRWPI